MGLRKSIVDRLKEIYPKLTKKWGVAQSEHNPRGVHYYRLMNGDMQIAMFGLACDSTCCGADILTSMNVEDDNYQVFEVLPKVAEDVAMHRITNERGCIRLDDSGSDVGLLYYTDSDEDIVEAVKKAGWKVATEFYNPNSGNNVTMLFKRLYAPR
jgi:hypothetical protein